MKRILVLFLSLCLIFTTPLIQSGAYGGEENTDTNTQSSIVACSVIVLCFLAILVVGWNSPKTDAPKKWGSFADDNWGWK
jgi:hypothetical protein